MKGMVDCHRTELWLPFLFTSTDLLINFIFINNGKQHMVRKKIARRHPKKKEFDHTCCFHANELNFIKTRENRAANKKGLRSIQLNSLALLLTRK